MNLKLQKFSKVSLAFLMMLFSIGGWAQTYNLVTSATQLEAGSEYIIAGIANGDLMILSTSQANNNRVSTQNGTSTTMPATIAFQNNYASLILGASGQNWTLYDGNSSGSGTSSGGTANGTGGNVGYLYPVNGQNYLRTKTAIHNWSISINATTSVASIQTSVNNRAIRLNSSGGLFAAYTTGQLNVYLYKKEASTQTATPAVSATGAANGIDTYWNTAQVSLASSSSGASIYYTLDGSTPTTSSNLYSAPFSISTTTTVKAIAVASPLTESAVASKSITISTPATATIPYTQNFNNTLGDWVNYKESGNAGYLGWIANTNGAESNGFNQGNSKGWLISPKFTGVQANSLLSFDYASQYQGTDLSVLYSTNYAGYGDPNAATWANLTTITEASGTAVAAGSLTNFVLPVSGNVHIAFVYNNPPSSWALWRVNNLVINLPAIVSTTWNGTAWSNGVPASVTDAVFEGLYSTSTFPAFTAKNIIIKNGGALEITSASTINAVDVTVENGGNLIQKDGSVLSFTGAFKVLKTGTSLVDKYAFWSSPVAGQTLNTVFTGFTPAFITEYNTTADNFVNAASIISAVGKGYSIKTPVANGSLVFEGAPNNGTQIFTTSSAGNGFNLVGNPYPSNLNLEAFYTANSARITSTMYFWDNKSNSVTTQNGASTTNVGYATFNAAGATWIPANNTPGAVIPSGAAAPVAQGFFVKALPTAPDNSLTFTNDMRVATAGTFFNKNNSSTEGKFWLRLNSSYNTNNTFAVTYSNTASNSFDLYDSEAIATGSDAFYTLADAQKLVIQGRETFNINDVVPVGEKNFENGSFTISLAQKEGLFSNGQAIYLHDKVSGTYTNLQNQAYVFTANAGEITNRFEIVYKLNVLATAEVQKEAFEVYRDGEYFFVRNNKNIEKIEIFDAAGRKIQRITENSKLVRIKLESEGLYILKAVSEGNEYIKKIIK